MGTASMIERTAWERTDAAFLISDSQIAFILQLYDVLIVTARSSPLAKRYSRTQLNAYAAKWVRGVGFEPTNS